MPSTTHSPASTAATVRRGDIFYADLSPVVGSEQGGLRPVLIIQNDVGNRYSPTVIAAAITSRMGKAKLPTHIDIYADRVGLARDSVILLEQIRTLDKRRLREKMGHLDDEVMEEVNNAIAVSFGLQQGLRESLRGGHENDASETPRPPVRDVRIAHNPIHEPRPAEDGGESRSPAAAATVTESRKGEAKG